MARRASSGINQKALITGLLLCLLVAAAGYFLFGRKKDSFAKAEPLVMAEVTTAGANMLAGNEYRVEGKIFDNRVNSSGQVITLEVGDEGSSDFLSLLITEEAKAKGVNFVRGQHYAFLVRFNTDGVAEALDVNRL
ncbi:MAG: hypothetical protein ACQKBY_13250 [Verrucomicrobiales bacterium]